MHSRPWAAKKKKQLNQHWSCSSTEIWGKSDFCLFHDVGVGINLSWQVKCSTRPRVSLKVGPTRELNSPQGSVLHEDCSSSSSLCVLAKFWVKKSWNVYGMFRDLVLPGFRVFQDQSNCWLLRAKTFPLEWTILEADSASKPKGTQLNQINRGFLIHLNEMKGKFPYQHPFHCIRNKIF